MDTFVQVFIFTDTAPIIFGKFKTDMIVAALLSVIGICVFSASTKFKKTYIRHILGLLAVGCGIGGSLVLVVSSMVYLNTISNYQGLQAAYDVGMYQIAEGVVQVGYAQPAGCNETGDLITIDNVEFEINYCHGAPFSYSQTINHHGVLTDGAHVRVYYTEGKTILRVDVKQ